MVDTFVLFTLFSVDTPIHPSKIHKKTNIVHIILFERHCKPSSFCGHSNR